MTWPILIAGFHIPKSDPVNRRIALDLLGEFGPHACFDNRAACRMLSEAWRLEDLGQAATPHEVASRLGSRPFLD